MAEPSEHPPVIGIDTNSYGFHAVSTLPVLSFAGQVASYGWVQIDKKTTYYHRLADIHEAALALFRKLPSGTTIFCEEALILRTNPETTRKLVMMAGLLYAAFLHAKPDATWFWVDIVVWRKEVLGKGGGRDMKSLARNYVLEGAKQLHGWDTMREVADEWDKQADLYEALCIRDYGIKQLNEGKVKIK